MGIAAEWFDPQRRILIEKIGYNWSWDDWQQSLDALYALAQSTSPGLILISEVPSDVSLPPGGFSQNMRDALNCHADAQFSAVIYAMSNPALRTLWQEAIERYAHPSIEYIFVESVAEALALVADV